MREHTESVSFRLTAHELVLLDKHARQQQRTRANLLQLIVGDWLEHSRWHDVPISGTQVLNGGMDQLPTQSNADNESVDG